ncbi:hypothetical protein [Leisingera sp. MMG026]|uniref:hypothetical protein n=1 Tax=Leisingera sp. MMG026 TaxID=2909982 RepID=UPI001F29BFB6|nr:hypothetical protein [Leisingera sp. MMG026]
MSFILAARMRHAEGPFCGQLCRAHQPFQRTRHSRDNAHRMTSMGKGAITLIVAEELRTIKMKMKHEKASYYKTHGFGKNATIELYLAGCDDEMVKAVTGHSGVELLKKYGGPIRQRELAKGAQEARNQLERSKIET